MKTKEPSIFKAFQNSDEYFGIISESPNPGRYVLTQFVFILLFSFLYGVVMGSYNGVLQSVVTGIKLPGLILLSLVICFPALYVIQSMIGSTMTMVQMINIIFSGFFVFTTIAISFSPIVIFFMITSDDYAFLKLLHVAIFTFSGFFAVKTIISGLRFACEKKNIYPKIGMSIFKMWVVILAFVSSQLAWNLRPFVGSRDMDFQIFRKQQGNFYVAIFQAIGEVFTPEQTLKAQTPEKNQLPDSTAR